MIFCAETEKNHILSKYLYFVSFSRIDPVTQNIRLSVCRHVAPLAECIRNHVPEESVQVLVQNTHATKCATDPECYICGLSILMFSAVGT